MQPITIYGKQGPNPPKVRILCEELGLPYTLIDTLFSEVKTPAYLAINPNGRMPAIVDPNTSLTLWESGAIMQYLIDTYDVAGRLSFAPGSNDAHLARQWLHFQNSGQGPYYGQAVWFTKYHPEVVESARARYCREIERVTGVLDGHLRAQEAGEDGGKWLVGGKCSYADLAFLPWQVWAGKVLGDTTDLSEFTEVAAWVERMGAREKVAIAFPEASSAAKDA
ncbi:glutathione S-transferas-like protein [Boeremia exigua]|uniref:glutathione S-transferase-like protein n=1 Tax=Boeremia exigua TaxID=749465 RepID=UPI001E8D51BD|nr:glutathione S-transferase-like protein [Boeremia exigua]KAH6618845.1 glutathione S-transferas-like protein [Boeremia exigua]